jgi:hypothetical protein
MLLLTVLWDNIPNSNLEEPSALFKMFCEAENALNCVLSVRRSGRFTIVCMKVAEKSRKKNIQTRRLYYSDTENDC